MANTPELSAAVTAAACTGLAPITGDISECLVLHVSGGGGGDPPVHLSSMLLDSFCAAGSGPKS